MGDSGSVFIFPKPGPDFVMFVVLDGLLSAARAISTIPEPTSEQTSELDALIDTAEREQSNLFVYAYLHGIDLPPEAAAVVFRSLLQEWSRGGRDNWVAAASYYELLPEITDAAAGPARILSTVVRAVETLVPLATDDRWIEEAMGKAHGAFLDLARLLSQAGYDQHALACAHTAANLVPQPTDPRHEAVHGLIARLARRAGNHDAAAFSKALRFRALAETARVDPDRRLDAFNAFEDAARELPQDPELRGKAARLLDEYGLAESYLEVLRPLLWLTLPEDERVPLPPEAKFLAAVARPVWDGTRDEWIAAIRLAMPWSVKIENARLALQPRPLAHEAVTLWNSWLLRHPALLRAIPHATSLEREENHLEMLMVLNHEVVHVYSMAGNVGLADLSLRWALFEQEIDLWYFALGEDGPRGEHPMLAARAVAPLKGPNVVALAQAEQALEMTLKLRALEDTWALWFEGIAILGELADSRRDPRAYSPVANVIAHLVDRNLVGPNVSPESFETAWQRAREQAEATYGDAVARHGLWRLRTYLEEYPRKYLGGYLAARAIVAAWRRTLEVPLSGAEAFRLLLHATRFGTADAIPDLALPLAQFRDSVCHLHRQWLVDIAGAPASDLRRLIDAVTGDSTMTRFRWHRGRVVAQTLESEVEEQRQVLERLQTLTVQARSGLCGTGAPLDRVTHASPACRAVMQFVAERLGSRPARAAFMTPEVSTLLLARQFVLPIGQTVAPFWILRAEHLLACMVRTTERGLNDGRPSYDAIVFPVDETKLEHLERLVAQEGSNRMLITRLADLTDVTPASGAGGLGANVIVFQYGDWLHIQPRGLYFGVTQVDSRLATRIEWRLQPNPVLRLQEEVVAGGNEGARRTKRWIESVSMSDWAAQPPGDVTPWVQHVVHLADEVLSRDENSPEGIRAAQEVLSFALGDNARADVLLEQDRAGLDPKTFDGLIRTLEKTFHHPVVDDRITELVTPVAEHLGLLLKLTSAGWDVAPPPAIPGR